MPVYNTPMKTAHISVLSVLLSLVLSASAPATESPAVTRIDPPNSILFVGNSFTFYNNAIYTHLRKLLVAEDPALRHSIFLKSMTISGATLSDHTGGLRQMLSSRSWDIVVMQGHSRAAIEADRLSGFQSTIRQFAAEIRSNGGEAVLFMTWAYAEQPEMTPELASAFTRLGHEEGLMVIPVGLAFAQAQVEIPGVVLHDSDRLHPSLEGTYLAAAVFYAAFYGKSPETLAYDAGLDETLAQGLRRIAWQTVSRYTVAPNLD